MILLRRCMIWGFIWGLYNGIQALGGLVGLERVFQGATRAGNFIRYIPLRLCMLYARLWVENEIRTVEGMLVGRSEGSWVGSWVGRTLGACVGTRVGVCEGSVVGAILGCVTRPPASRWIVLTVVELGDNPSNTVTVPECTRKRVRLLTYASPPSRW